VSPRRAHARRLLGLALAAAVVAGLLATAAYRELVVDSASAAAQRLGAAATQALAPGAASESEARGVRRAQIALGEYEKGVAESPPHCNCGAEIDEYTGGVHKQWCTYFASWVAEEAGLAVTGDEDSGSWRTLNSQDFMRKLQQQGTWYPAAEVEARDLRPRPGDFVVYRRGPSGSGLGHVDVVIAPTADGRATLVGGNLHDRVLLRSDFDYEGHYGFLGFGRPEKD